MSKITLNNVGSLIDATTAQTTINNNSAVVQTAFDNTLSRDGTSPNQMGSNIDMNSNRIVNLTNALSAQEPVTLQQLNTLIGGGTITTGGVPNGGVTNAALIKQSATNQDTKWSTPTGTGNSVYSTSPTITSPTLVTPALGTPASGTLTNCTGLPITSGVSGLGANVSTFLSTPDAGPLAVIIPSRVGSGNLVFATSPTLVTPALGSATATSVAATAGITSSGGGIGYATGAGGAVTQLTSKVTAVTLNALTGVITTSNSSMTAGGLQSFTFNNSFITTSTELIVCSYTAASNPSFYVINFTATGAGTATCDIRNVSGLTPAEVITIRFAIIRSVNS